MTDGDFSDGRAHLGVEAVAVHAAVAGGVAVTDHPGQEMTAHAAMPLQAVSASWSARSLPKMPA